MKSWRGKTGFTLIELLVSIAIMALLTTLLIPSIDRSLSRNNLANDVSLLRSKLEETRLLAASTQQEDQSTVGYYAVVLPANATFFSIIRAQDSSESTCPIAEAARQASVGGQCLVEKIALSKGVKLSNNEVGASKLVLFRSPTQQTSAASCRPGVNGLLCSAANGAPSFSNWGVKLQFQAKTATVTLEDYTAKLTVKYEENN